MQGVNSALEGLVSHKVGQMQQKQQQTKTAQGLKALLPGLSDKDAHSYALLDPKILEQVVKSKMEAPTEEAFAQALSQRNGGGQQQVQEQQPPQQQMGQQPTPENVVGEYTPWQPNMTEYQKHLPAFLKSPEAKGMFTPEEQQQMLAELNQGQQPQQEAQQAAKPKPRLTSKQALELAKLDQGDKKLEQKERHFEKKFEQDLKSEAYKETKDYRKEVIAGSNDAKQTLHDLDRMEELQKEGKLDTPGYVEFLERSGLNIPALTEEGSQEFQKISNNFLRFAKNYYGGRVSNNEMEQFLRTVPALSQSPLGRQRIISNLKNINRLAVETNKAMKEVIAKNKGLPPLDLMEQVDDKLDSKREQLALKFRADLAKPVPKGQNKLITALQSVAGSAAGTFAKPLAGAAIGAAFGGPVGAGIGGLGGLGANALSSLLSK
jgi:hypothetical protein